MKSFETQNEVFREVSDGIRRFLGAIGMFLVANLSYSLFFSIISMESNGNFSAPYWYLGSLVIAAIGTAFLGLVGVIAALFSLRQAMIALTGEAVKPVVYILMEGIFLLFGLAMATGAVISVSPFVKDLVNQ